MISPFTCIIITFTLLFTVARPSSADPQTYLIKYLCYTAANATDPAQFISNLNATFADLRRNLTSGSHFAIATRVDQLVQPVYTLFQCRLYLATQDCLACLDTASSAALIACGNKPGAQFQYDGCFLRYEVFNFFDAGNPDNVLTVYRANRTVPGTEFSNAVREALGDVAANALIGVGSPTVSKAVIGGGRVYAVGECRLTVGTSDCGNCLSSTMSEMATENLTADGRGVQIGCFLRYSQQAFFGVALAPQFGGVARAPQFGTPQFGERSKKSRVIPTVCAAIGGIILLSLIAGFFCWRRWRHAYSRMVKESNLGLTELRGPTILSYQLLKGATRNFDKRNKLGAGGFGSVYKGVMSNGTVVAVKKLNLPETSRARADFDSEVRLISNIRHRNLVRLLGCCNEGHHLILVYEFMPNGSLDKYLYGDKKGSLDWKERMNIILGMAKGLIHLHEEFPVCIIHRDIKSSNILLDNELNARIADFGLAKLLPADKSHLSTKVAGTLGYTAPEYAFQGQITAKTDAYSFGMVVLEVVSGRPANTLQTEPVIEYLLELAWRLYESDSLMELVDKDLHRYEAEEVKRVIEIGLMCTQSVSSRPIMSDVLALLRSKVEQKLELRRPSFINDMAAAERGDKPTSTPSDATISLSGQYGR